MYLLKLSSPHSNYPAALNYFSEETMADLPEDLLIQILLNLPVKSLVRFRCVSKHWCNLIRSPEFINMHLDHEKRDETILVKRFHKGAAETSLPLHADKLLDPFLQNLEIPGLDFVVAESILQSSCNGLICISPDHKNYYVFNPALHELKQIPTRPFDAAVASKPFIGKVGFGFDPTTNHYKVVSLEKFEDDKINIPLRCFQPRIYNLSTDSWREIDDEIPSLIDGPYSQVLFKGRCHWVANHMSIFSFDFSTEVFGVMELPDPILLENNGEYTSLSVLNQSFSLIQHAEDNRHDQRTDIWVMEEYGVKESWAKYYSIQFAIDRPLTFWNDILFVQGRYGRLVSLSLCTTEDEATAFPIFAEDFTMEIVNYRESLVSFK
ncbi:F-box/kelch-repeat protein At3g06240-like [Primulina huaijiensis]|uniref:F-box/kelch-repeat protein At3g06240-like n=1 Tax=Primulina huaijiensis TaxID=1492673 RepID=UPI003CC75018